MIRSFVIFIALFVAVTHGNPRTAPDYDNRVPQFMRNRSSRRIIGGTPADIKDFPHMLALYDLSSVGFICGASVVSERWALSAAHCLQFKVPPTYINLRGGSTYHASGGMLFFVEFYNLHPEFNRVLYEYDVAVLRTTTLMRGTNIEPIVLPLNCYEHCCHTCPPQEVTVTGWGRNAAGQYPSNLYKITLPIVDRQGCSDAWNGIYDMFFCIYNGVGKDSCTGDSGSPIIKKIGLTPMQIGIVSFGVTNCGDGSMPSVSTRIEAPKIRDFIFEQTGL